MRRRRRGPLEGGVEYIRRRRHVSRTGLNMYPHSPPSSPLFQNDRAREPKHIPKMQKSNTLDDPNRIVKGRRSYTNKCRADLVRYWKTPSVVDEKSPSGRLRCPTLGEVECHTSVPKSNVDRWAKEEEKILRGRAEARVNRSAKGPRAG
jgi:hypothetical protein